ncbi:hypothetical protein [Arthrobacter sp. Y-9]|uniref:hypothetical protein n=1 Tax=Arthrobacter sp. Y-9 TaxID=3039385 RepID=UPI00241DFBCA|nr:hypothetical protein [Arthrobacter sp. Y-9]WFR83894.1 hypothetical protein P9849_15235 [Arthrobacter sp. Y-9]
MLGLALLFRNPISDFLRKIRKVGFPGGSLDAEADEASSEVDEVDLVEHRADEVTPIGHSDYDNLKGVAKNCGPELPSTETPEEPSIQFGDERREARNFSNLEYPSEVPSSNSLGTRLEEYRNRYSIDKRKQYEGYRQLALTSPEEAVREAFQRLRLGARRLLQDTGGSVSGYAYLDLGSMVNLIAQRGLVPIETSEPARRLDRIYSSLETEVISAKGALSFVEAAQKMDSLLSESRRAYLEDSRARLRRLAPKLEERLESLGLPAASFRLTAMSNSYSIRIDGEIGDFDGQFDIARAISELTRFARQESTSINLRFADISFTLGSR